MSSEQAFMEIGRKDAEQDIRLGQLERDIASILRHLQEQSQPPATDGKANR